jgi:hypothetical protein
MIERKYNNGNVVDILNRRGREFLKEALSEPSGGLLSNIPENAVDDTPRDQESSREIWIRVDRRPAPPEIDYPRTSEDVLLDNQAILKDGRHVTW